MPADTFSNTIGLLLMGTGNDNNTWGINCNTSDFQIIEDAIANELVETVTGGTLDLSGTPPPAAPSQVRFATITFQGTLTSGQTVKVPNLKKWWKIRNNTTGAFTLSIQTPTGGAVTIPQNSAFQDVYCDGSNNIIVSPYNYAQFLAANGVVGTPSYSFANSPATGFYRAGANQIGWAANGVQGATFNSDTSTTWAGTMTVNGNFVAAGSSITINSTTWTFGAGAGAGFYLGIAGGSSVGQIIDGAGSVVTTGQKGQIFIPFAMTITAWAVMADQAGSVTIDILRANDAVPVSSIVGAGTKPNLSGSQYSGRIAPSSWTATTLAKNDWIAFNVTAASTVQRVSIALQCTRTGL